MDSSDDAARWECLSLDLAELLQAIRRLECIAQERGADHDNVTAISAALSPRDQRPSLPPSADPLSGK